jgi:protein gp37
MSAITSIEWTDRTWNPVTGCTKVSQGCKNCYAETIAKRFWKDRKFTNVRIHPDRLDEPLRWRKPSRIFVNSMSDLFHEDVTFEFIDKVIDVAFNCPQHTFQILTKRPNRMKELMPRTLGGRWGDITLNNVWLGVSVEDQKTADERIPILLQTPAAIRFVSYEPALGAIDFYKFGTWDCSLDWIICGGESGHGARPCDIDYFRDVLKWSKNSSVKIFIKQLGSQPFEFNGDGESWLRKPSFENSCGEWYYQHKITLKHNKGGDPEEWPEDLRIREFPQNREM